MSFQLMWLHEQAITNKIKAQHSHRMYESDQIIITAQPEGLIRIIVGLDLPIPLTFFQG